MVINTKYNLGQLVLLKNVNKHYEVKAISISVTGDVLSHNEYIVYEIEGPCSGKRIIVKENQLDEV